MSEHILVVDDDPAVADVLATLLTGVGYQVHVVPDAEDALDRLRHEPVDVLVTDLGLPGMDGWQLIARAIQTQPMLHVIAMTGRDEPEDAERAATVGVPLLRKPFSFVALQGAIAHAHPPARATDVSAGWRVRFRWPGDSRITRLAAPGRRPSVPDLGAACRSPRDGDGAPPQWLAPMSPAAPPIGGVDPRIDTSRRKGVSP